MNIEDSRLLEILKKQGFEADEAIARELIRAYQAEYINRQERLKEAERMVLALAKEDFLNSIKNI